MLDNVSSHATSRARSASFFSVLQDLILASNDCKVVEAQSDYYMLRISRVKVYMGYVTSRKGIDAI